MEAVKAVTVIWAAVTNIFTDALGLTGDHKGLLYTQMLEK